MVRSRGLEKKMKKINMPFCITAIPKMRWHSRQRLVQESEIFVYLNKNYEEYQ